MTMDEDYLYHYTSANGMDGILVSSFIAPSIASRIKVSLDEGVHFTDLPPTTGKATILRNNYGSSCTCGERRDRAEYFVRVPRSQVAVRKETTSDGRVAYVHEGSGLNLRTVDYQCGRVEQDDLDSSPEMELAWMTLAGGVIGALVLANVLSR